MGGLEWLATLLGGGLVVAGLRDVFHTLLHPSGVGTISVMIFRATSDAARRLGRGLKLAGPLAVVGTVSAWTGMLALGAALVYWPHLPDGFELADGLERSEQDGILDALYLSVTALSTLGFGDIVAESTWLRLALVIEALIGFGLLTASLSWILSVYPALMRRRSLAVRIHGLVEGQGDDARLARDESMGTRGSLLHQIAAGLASVRVDLVQFPATYFFRGPGDEFSLAAALRRLQPALARDDLPTELRPAAQVLRHAINGLGETLRQGPFGLEGGDADAALRGYLEAHADCVPPTTSG